MTFTITGLTYSDLSATEKTAFSDKIKAKFVADLTEIRDASTLTVTLSAGSVAVSITITGAPTNVAEYLETAEPTEAAAWMLPVVQEVVIELSIAPTGSLAITGWSTEATLETSAPTDGSSEDAASGAFSVQVPLAAKAVAAFAGVALAAIA